MDMTEGIIARFKTMAISRSSVLAGHVLGSLVQSVGGVVVVLAVALLMGFWPSAGVLDWLLRLALITLISIAVIWLCVALGLVSQSVESASNLPMFLTLLPFFGSGFVPTESIGRLAALRRVPALHTHDRSAAGPTGRRTGRWNRDPRDHLVPRHQHRRVQLGPDPLPAAPSSVKSAPSALAGHEFLAGSACLRVLMSLQRAR